MRPTSRLLSGNWLLLLLLLATTFLIYQPGLYGDYVFDDVANITTNTSLVITDFSWSAIREAATSSFSGPLKRPVSMLSFAFNASTTGLGAPLFFKLTGLFVHLATGVAVFWLAGLLLKRFRSLENAANKVEGTDWTCLAITAIWLLHPLNLSSVIYIVQRMTSLSALFALLAAAVYCIGRQRLERSQEHAWALIGCAFIVFLPLSVLSKENGVLIPVLLFVIEITAFRFEALGKSNRILLGMLGLITVLIPCAAFLSAVLMHDPRIVSGYELRDFSMLERMLTQGRVLWFYLRLALAPSVGSLGLYHDDFETSTGILAPISTLFAWGGLCGLLVLAILLRRKIPAVTFGILWFLCGHLLESTVLPLEMVHEHRNYLPLFGLVFAACYFLLERLRGHLGRRQIVFALAAYIALISFVTFIRAEQWGDSVLHTVSEAENHPRSARAQNQLGRTFMMMMIESPRIEYYTEAKKALEKGAELSKIGVLSQFSLIQLAYLEKKPVDPLIVAAAERRLSNGPIPPSTGPAFRALIDCQMFAYCKMADVDVVRLANAALENPRAVKSVTTQIAIYLTQYQIDKMGDGDLAALTLKNALRLDPESAALHLSAARVLRVMRDFGQSAQHLEQATRFDSAGTYRRAISEEKEKWERDFAKTRN